jgi:predicted membrane-bound spermidine synthase
MNGKKSLIGAIFFASGFSSLIYQAAWQRILTLYYSVENISTTLIVTVYMLGLGLGAIMGGRIAERATDKVRLYFFIELAIGLFGLVSMPFMEVVGKNTAAGGHLVSFACMFLLLCIPTMLMGMTLPLLTKIFNGVVNNFLQSLSYLYFINTLGAALGVLTTSYILISFGGLDISIYTAVAINICIAVTLILFKKQLSYTGNHNTENDATPVTAATNTGGNLQANIIYTIVFATGFIAIGYEIIWFRMIGTIVKASPYSFSTVLAVYLTGIALGSFLMKKLLAGSPRLQRVNRRELFFSLQVFIAVYVLLSISAYHFLVNHSDAVRKANFSSFNNLFHPSADGPPNWRIGSVIMWLIHHSDIIVWPSIFILVPTLLMGASFPLVTSLAYTKGREADTVGKIYFFNVLGNVAGGLVTGLYLLGAIGTEYALLLLSFIGLLFIFFNGNNLYIKGVPAKILFIGLFATVSFVFFPSRLQLYKTIHPAWVFKPNDKKIITEGTDGVIATYINGQKLITFINGMAHGGRPGMFFFHEVAQTLAYKPNTGKVLVIGLGTGTLIEALKEVSPLPDITLIELSDALLNNLHQVDTLHTLLTDKHIRVICADGRSFLHRDTEKYDAVFTDPLLTTTSFSNNIYSRQFFELVKAHLTPNGVLMTWMDEQYVIPKTLCTVFPYVNKYSNFAVSSNSQLKEDTAYMAALVESYPPAEKQYVKQFAGNEPPFKNRQQILQETKSYRINEDYRPVCEYFLGYRDNYRGTGIMFYNHPLMQ